METVWNASLHIMGSRSFQTMAPYWPTSTMEFAPPMNQIPKAVFSTQGPAVLKAAATTRELKGARDRAGDTHTGQLQPGAESWAEAYVANGDLAEEIAKLKAEDGKPILAHGGASFARSLIAQNLVDEYALTVHPIVLGKGSAIFSELTRAASTQVGQLEDLSGRRGGADLSAGLTTSNKACAQETIEPDYLHGLLQLSRHRQLGQMTRSP